MTNLDVLDLIERGNRLSALQLKRLEVEGTALWRRLAPVPASHGRAAVPNHVDRAQRLEGPWAGRPFRRGDGRYHAADMTGVFNLIAPCPALSVPCGWDAQALPIGLQVVGRRWREDTVLQIGRAVEMAIPGAIRRRPI